MGSKEAARRSSSCARARVSTTADTRILAKDAALGILGAVIILGVPFVMAVLKQWGWW